MHITIALVSLIMSQCGITIYPTKLKGRRLHWNHALWIRNLAWQQAARSSHLSYDLQVQHANRRSFALCSQHVHFCCVCTLDESCSFDSRLAWQQQAMTVGTIWPDVLTRPYLCAGVRVTVRGHMALSFRGTAALGWLIQEALRDAFIINHWLA